MSRTTRNWILGTVAVVLAAVFVRLGIWQMERHYEAKARAERHRARVESPVLEVGAGPLPPTEGLLWRRVVLRGRFEHEETVVLRGRGFQGTPGIHVATPLVRATGPDVMVVRGWMPAPDGIDASLSRGVPSPVRAATTVRGLALPGADSTGDLRRANVEGATRLVVARLAPGPLADSLGRPLASFYIQALTDRAFEDPSAPRNVGWGGRPPSAGDDSLPVVLGVPEMDAGPHLGYALQWFAFALISLGGTGAYLLTRGRETRESSPEDREA